MSAHTPGPWRVGENDRNDQPTVCEENGTWLVAVIPHGCLGSMEAVAAANASLIAASPELLAALKEMVSEWPAFARPRCVRRAEAAIAKAEGES